MNKSVSKYQNTAELMDQALLLLLETKEYDYITVKEVCAKAGVNRSTFYLHYESLDDLLIESVEYITNKLFKKYDTELMNKDLIEKSSLDDLFFITPKYIIPYLEFIKENKNILSIVTSESIMYKNSENFDKIYKNVLEPILIRHKIPDDQRKYVVYFYTGGINSIVIKWLKNNCKESIEEIGNIIMSCISKKWEKLKICNFVIS